MKEKKLSEAAREIRNAYLRRWRSEHKEKVKAYNATYWERKTSTAAASNQQKEV